MSLIAYGDPEHPVRAWEVLEQQYAQHRNAADQAQEELESLLKRVERTRDAVRYHANAAEECLSAARVVREAAGRPLPELDPVAEGDR